MNTIQTDEPSSRKPLRLWPGVAIVTLQLLGSYVVPRFLPNGAMIGVAAGIIGGLVILLWWLFFSRAQWVERIGAVPLMVVGLFATSRIAHPSISNGMMGMMLPIYAMPILCLALVVWAAASRRFSNGPRRAGLALAILLACGVFTLIRTGGITGEASSDFHWRWTPSPEERLLAQPAETPSLAAAPATLEHSQPSPNAESASPTPTPADVKNTDKQTLAGAATPTPSASPETAKARGDWPGFRGPNRDGVIRGVQIETDWTKSPPVALWNRPIGPGWSSFAVRGGLVYTQEQRGEEEIVSCYNLIDGKPVWVHRDAARFWESNAGAGPRATPTLSNGRVYTFGATGIVNALNARDGAVIWTRNAATDTKTKTPGWGFAGSPLVVGDVVIVAASGALAAYETAGGKPRWYGPAGGGGGYSSPQLAMLGGIRQVLLMNGDGAIGVAPADGSVLWKYAWSGDGIVQPAVTSGGDILLGAGSGMGAGMGVRRVSIAQGADGWTTEERWTSNGLKPYYNDFVVHKGHAYGFDGSILACINLEDGKRKWKGGRYGHGQLILLPDQDLLLVLSEEGELALVKASADQFTELAKMPAIEGKTWNHPVLVGDTLLVRNSEKMAAFRVALR